MPVRGNGQIQNVGHFTGEITQILQQISDQVKEEDHYQIKET